MAPLPCFIVVIAATVALDGDTSRWWERDDVRQQLSLTTSQTASIDDIFNEDLAERAARRRELARLEEELHTALWDGDNSIHRSHASGRPRGDSPDESECHPNIDADQNLSCAVGGAASDPRHAGVATARVVAPDATEPFSCLELRRTSFR